MSLSVVENQREIWRRASKKYSEKNKDKIKLARERRGKEYSANTSRKYAHRNKDKINEKARKVYENPNERLKIKVRAKTNYIFEKKKRCEDCKEIGKTEFHHTSYEPNIFIELCKCCHNKVHGRELYVIE